MSNETPAPAVAGRLDRQVRSMVDALRALPDIRPEPEPFEVWRDVCGLALTAADEIEALHELLRQVRAERDELAAGHYAAVAAERERCAACCDAAADTCWRGAANEGEEHERAKDDSRGCWSGNGFTTTGRRNTKPCKP